MRDEAHRFAIRHHRSRRSKGMTVSALDDVPGLGPARRAALLKHFGSVTRLRAASVEEIATVPGMGPQTALTVHGALQGTSVGPVPIDVAPADVAPAETATLGAERAGESLTVTPGMLEP